MGDSMPPPASFDLVGSFARRRGSDVEIVLAKPQVTGSASATVALSKGGSTVQADGELAEDEAGGKLVVRAPRSEFSDGIWTMVLRSDEGNKPLAARLLVQGERPLVLLWGAKTNPSVRAPQRASAGKRRAAATAGRALDRALAALPEDKAMQLRSRARRTAQKVLG